MFRSYVNRCLSSATCDLGPATLRFKFQLSGPRLRRIVHERNYSSHKSLKRERGVGGLRDASHQKGHLTGEGPGHSERADNSKISQIPIPSLALQASMVFAFIGSLDLRPVVRPASGRGLASSSMRELALQSGFGQECLTYA